MISTWYKLNYFISWLRFFQIKEYGFREDGMKYWAAIEKYTKDVVFRAKVAGLQELPHFEKGKSRPSETNNDMSGH